MPWPLVDRNVREVYETRDFAYPHPYTRLRFKLSLIEQYREGISTQITSCHNGIVRTVIVEEVDGTFLIHSMDSVVRWEEIPTNLGDDHLETVFKYLSSLGL